jgi:pSer/pThr/pTyr-binding forkhead associated (FHA) protein
MVYSPDRAVRKLDSEPGAPSRAVLAGAGRRTVLSDDRMVIGRSRDCDITVDDANISREHAELRRGGDGWKIVDLGSTNGVKVNRRRIDQAQLKHGDRITVGVTDLDFELE